MPKQVTTQTYWRLAGSGAELCFTCAATAHAAKAKVTQFTHVLREPAHAFICISCGKRIPSEKVEV